MTDKEIDNLFKEVEFLLEEEAVTDDADRRRSLIVGAISKTQDLLRCQPREANFHHLLGLAWYHHPDKTATRSKATRDALHSALDIDPCHQFANQFLGYINFDEGKYDVALKHFLATDHNYFRSLPQIWRSLKATELAIVCELRLGRSVDSKALNTFFEEYLSKDCEDISNTAITLELRSCAEWLFDQDNDITRQPLFAIANFLDEAGNIEQSNHSGFKAAWSRWSQS